MSCGGETFLESVHSSCPVVTRGHLCLPGKPAVDPQVRHVEKASDFQRDRWIRV